MPGTRIDAPLDDGMKEAILLAFWSIRIDDLNDFNAYFSFYQEVCRGLAGGRGTQFTALAGKNHEDILTIINEVWKTGETKTSIGRPELRRALKQHQEFQASTDTALNASINLALRLWTTIPFLEPVTTDNYGSDEPGSIIWDDNTRLVDFVSAQFVPDNGALRRSATALTTAQRLGPKLERNFSAQSLNSLHGVRTHVTKNIINHLLFDDSNEDDKVLNVFPMKLFLVAHKRSKTNILPESLILETTRTLGILFPSSSEHEYEKSSAYLKEYHPDISRSAEYPFSWTSTERPSMSSFVHWRDRLDTIYTLYKSKPTSFWRSLRDFRDPQEWLTFWMGLVAILIMTFVFGCISTATAIYSAVYAYRGFVISKEGLDIARDAASSAAASAASSSSEAAAAASATSASLASIAAQVTALLGT
ncbi:hypothetical protein ONS96_014850 [Cadophora gregata f. sp. sojae]|nr:hypothetical protein ONS96_014850 [Cadophora gregata f. sp. sojae]